MNDTWIRALVLSAIFGTVLLAVSVLIDWYASSRAEGRAINLRLKLIGQGRSRGETLKLLRRSDSALPTGLPAPLAKIGADFERILDQAQLTIPTPRLMVIILLAPVVIFFTLLLVLFSSGQQVGFGTLLILGTFSLVLGAVLPLMVLRIKANRTRKKMEDQFPVALDVFVRGLRAGHPIAAALDLLTVEMSDPIGSQFGIVVDEVTYGAELRDALQAMADRWDLDDMRMFVVSLSVQSETGGNLAEVLENLSGVIRDRQAMMLKVRALSSEGRMTAMMLTGLPVLTFALLFIGQPRFFLDVSADPWFVPGFAILIGLYFLGVYIIRRLIDLKV